MIDWIGVTISDAKGKVTHDGAFLTSLRVRRKNVAEIAACARARGKIDSESFNVLKNNGYHLEHNFGHGHNIRRHEPAGLRLPHRLRLPRRLMDQSARGKTRPQALLPAHQNDHCLSGLSLLGSPYDNLDQIKAAPEIENRMGNWKNGAGKHLELLPPLKPCCVPPGGVYKACAPARLSRMNWLSPCRSCFTATRSSEQDEAR
jgi:hypothetical protein